MEIVDERVRTLNFGLQVGDLLLTHCKIERFS